MERITKLSDDDVQRLLETIFQDFSERHRYFRENLERNFERVAARSPNIRSLSPQRQLLVGAYHTSEFSVESVALFNPSIVLHPDQKGVSKGSKRFVMSFRATGEGHVSSIEFRSGIIDENHDLYFDHVSHYVDTPEIHTDPLYNRLHFQQKLEEIGAHARLLDRLLEGLGQEFNLGELQTQIKHLRSSKFRIKDKSNAIDAALWLARSNYECVFRHDHHISERVIFPVTENEIRGMEDARFVRFVDEDGAVKYYATFTAYSGFAILPQLLVTTDFLSFKIHTLNGNAVQNKGMALFPRKIDGQYVMLSRQDGVNNYIMRSDNVFFWNEATLIQEPAHPLQFVQIGNCGSPLETPEGWLALFHGVGPMRKDSVWAALLDIDDPSKIIGQLEEPLLTPDEDERDGYVPNVVYTCGSMIHEDELIIPYAIADQRCRIATVPIRELLSRLKANQ
ncbi:MAG: glycoside hydrolase family 130 protein [Alphaproteobacteria bacterium]|nr:glycoside hydrolase family 130 protein [Alphaproteobacteria bacterium]